MIDPTTLMNITVANITTMLSAEMGLSHDDMLRRILQTEAYRQYMDRDFYLYLELAEYLLPLFRADLSGDKEGVERFWAVHLG